MMNYLWVGMVLFSIICAVCGGTMEATSAAVLAGGQKGVELGLKLLGMLCLWSGLMRVAERSGLTEKISRLLRPLLRLLFPGIEADSPAGKAISMNITANFMGLGNAATPLGLTAMKELQALNPLKKEASDAMINFVVMNTAALNLVPTSVAMLRYSFGSKTPMDIMPAAWATSLCAMCCALLMVRLLRGRKKKN